jgi:hypothetical protein
MTHIIIKFIIFLHEDLDYNQMNIFVLNYDYKTWTFFIVKNVKK